VNGEQIVTLAVNGRQRSVRTTPMTTLLTVLRDQLFLTGAKRGCNQGVCGACTILVDDQPVRGCLSLAINLVGRAITTVEGLTQQGEFKPIQQAFQEGGAVQCGFCTSGVLISTWALLRQNPRPSADQVRLALSGNLCRCSGYIKIIEAVCRAGERSRHE
jgi:aerobic carbon-monoxide dehydrogenase small subunit